MNRILRVLKVSLVLGLAQLVHAKEIYVAKNGNDANSGTLVAPYLTIAKASAVAVAGDNVYIREGSYEETLKPANSGSVGNPITFQGYQNEKVVITAMEALSGFTKDVGNIYKKTVSWDLDQRNFIINEHTVLDLARWPNNTDGNRFTLNSVRNDGGSQDEVSVDAFLTDTDIPNLNWANGGSLMFYGDRPGSGWTTWRAYIKSSSAGRVDFDAMKNQSWIITAHPPGDKGDYFLEGIKEALDYQNEWYFDKATKTLYIQLPNGAAPVDGQVKMSRRERVIDLTSRNYIEIKHLAVFGGSVEIAGNNNKFYEVSSFYGSMTRGITPNFNSGVNAFNINWGAQNTTIEKCEIGFGDGSGVWDSGTGTTVKNSYVHDFDFLGSYDAPVMIRGQANAKLLNCHITRGGRDAIQIISKGSEVAWNNVSQSNLIADDCALIYSIGPNLNMDIHHNWFHDAEGRGGLKKAAGIYLDNDAGNVRVYRNVVWNTEWTSAQINWNGKDIDVFNNTLVKGVATMGAWHMAGTQFTNVKVWNNITDKEGTSAGGQETETTWEPQSDRQNNIVSKESFVDWANNDFHLKANMPAIDYGRVITGYTDGFKGANPDAGAYELGDNWVPGVSWDIKNGAASICYGLPGETCSDIVSPPVNVAPTASFANVTANQVLVAGSSLPVSVNTADSDGTITKVELYLNNVLLRAETTAPYEWNLPTQNDPALKNLVAGNYTLKAISFDNGGLTTTITSTFKVVNPIQIAGILQAEEFSLQSGIQTETTTDLGGGLNIGYIENNYFTEYFVNVEATNIYDLKIRAASGSNGGIIDIYEDNVLKTTVSVTKTASWQSFQDFKGQVSLSAGIHKLKLVYRGTTGFLMNLNYVSFTPMVTGLDDLESASFFVYPNPTPSSVNLSASTVWLLTSLQEIPMLNGEGSSVDLSELPSGVYLLKAQGQSIRIIKQ